MHAYTPMNNPWIFLFGLIVGVALAALLFYGM